MLSITISSYWIFHEASNLSLEIFYNLKVMRHPTISFFIDSPSLNEFKSFLSEWQRQELPDGLKLLSHPDGLLEEFNKILQNISSLKNLRRKTQLERTAVQWLYSLIRLNIKRGRQFELRKTLETGRADCLGYSKLFTVLGRLCGIHTGIAEVIEDNAGRIVPHTATMVKLSNVKVQFVDFWYGSIEIKHKVLGLLINRAAKWNIEDIDYKMLQKIDVDYLPDSRVDGITLYIQGNGHLRDGEFTEAVKSYTKSLTLYPGNPRFHYNRAIALEKLGQFEKAQNDYAQAMRDENAIRRVLAKEYEEEISLIKLDELGIPEKDQQVYLLHQGFITGRNVPINIIARKLKLTKYEVKSKIRLMERILKV